MTRVSSGKIVTSVTDGNIMLTPAQPVGNSTAGLKVVTTSSLVPTAPVPIQININPRKRFGEPAERSRGTPSFDMKNKKISY